MKFAIVLGALAGCGRIGFDSSATVDVESQGQLDPSFGNGGIVLPGTGGREEAYDVIARSGGYLTNGFRVVGMTSRFEMIALTSDGSLDSGYGMQGYLRPTPSGSEFGYGLLPRSDGTLFVVGDGSNGTDDDIVIRAFEASGTPVATFGTGGVVIVNSGAGKDDTSTRAVVLGDDIVVCGTADYAGTNSTLALVAVTATGAPADGFGTNGVVFDDLTPGEDSCNDIVVDRRGRLVVAGKAGPAAVIARYTASGAHDMTFGIGGSVRVGVSGYAFGVAIADNDDIIVAGEDANHGTILRVTDAGILDSGFGQGGVVTLAAGDLLTDVAIQPNDKLIVVGTNRTGSTTDALVMRLLADGSPDLSFGTGGALSVDASDADAFEAVQLGADGKIVAVGSLRPDTLEQTLIVRIE